MAPPIDVVGQCPELGDVEAPLRSRSSLSSEVESEPPGRARRRPSAKVRAESEPWGRAKRGSSSSGAEPESEPWGRAKRSSSSSGAEPESEPWGRVKRSSSSSGAEPECHTRISGHQDPGANIITRCAGTKSHTYDESWHRIECHIFTI
jgi:hypothetical protein